VGLRRVDGVGDGGGLEEAVGPAGYRVSCSNAMPQFATECFAWRLCAISCITDVTVMQEML